MANTTFNGPVRSEAGHKVITKNTTTGAVSEHATLNSVSTGDVSSNSAGSLLLNAAATNT